MIDHALQARFVKSCGTAALDYAAAANQAWFEATSQALTLWSRTLGVTAEDEQPRSWYRHPDKAAQADLFGGQAAGVDPFKLQFDAWTAMMTAPWSLTPAAWPSAYMMMSGGVPRSVAWPAAEAHAAAADAARTAVEVIGQMSSSYRSDGGHAVAQVIILPLKASLAAASALGGAANWTELFAPFKQSIGG